ncbi:MAG: Z1 domain-containing protein [candidate division Zixibacteria bacterium]|nr:Z1 domain-containing protein [candidate division Zixibacteria bacterium]
MVIDGPFYSTLLNNPENPYSDELKACIKEVVQNLLDNDTSANKPGMLLGKIQSGKTHTYLGVIALAFDNGYDVVLVLTKGTKALAQQTYERLERQFQLFMENDSVQLFDIMNLPNNLTRYELNQKIIIVAKKETNNLTRVRRAFFTTYAELAQRRVLIIDDEADFASVGFKRTKQEQIEINRIASQIDELRRDIEQLDFLQVTATPYSLYLQPDNDETNQIYEPKRPAFTVLVPIHPGYIGGDFYFDDNSEQNSAGPFIYVEVSNEELSILRRPDRRSFRIEEALTSPRIRSLRSAIVNFIVGSCIRRIQDRQSGMPVKRFSFIVHTEAARQSHKWQEQIVRQLVEQLANAITSNRSLFDQLVEQSYQELARSIGVMNHFLPPLLEVNTEVISALNQDFLMITVVNSEKNVNELLDEQGQLRLRTPLNIFIGGQILDRGITIRNLIGFYYGRRPNQFQQDTVLQHSRMYGFRPIQDLTVTRFYTTIGIHQAMRNIHIFDCALREAFLRGAQRNGIVFLRLDNQNRIVPCSPNKILLSTTTTLFPNRRILPVGFQTGYRTNISRIVSQIDDAIADHYVTGADSPPFLLDVEEAKKIIDLINQTLIFEEDFHWDAEAFKASLDYLSKNSSDQALQGKIHCLVRTDRNLNRFKADGSFSDAPDTASTEGRLARETAIDIPLLMLFRQNGSEADNWRGCPFWWPVLYTPRNTQTVIFATDITD